MPKENMVKKGRQIPPCTLVCARDAPYWMATVHKMEPNVNIHTCKVV